MNEGYTCVVVYIDLERNFDIINYNKLMVLAAIEIKDKRQKSNGKYYNIYRRKT